MAVTTLTITVCGPPSILSVPSRPNVTTGICLERQVVPSVRMEVLLQHYQAAGFLREVSRLAAAPRRESRRQGGYASLTGPQGKDLIRLVPQLLKYDLFDTHGLSPQTIKGYRSCLASFLSRTGMAAAVQAKTISDMIMSMELQRPRLTPVLPQ